MWSTSAGRGDSVTEGRRGRPPMGRPTVPYCHCRAEGAIYNAPTRPVPADTAAAVVVGALRAPQNTLPAELFD